jgi:hypothetical protein
MPRALGCLGVSEADLVREVMRASEVSHCGAAFLMGLPWGSYRVAVGEAVKMAEERGRNGG